MDLSPSSNATTTTTTTTTDIPEAAAVIIHESSNNKLKMLNTGNNGTTTTTTTTTAAAMDDSIRALEIAAVNKTLSSSLADTNNTTTKDKKLDKKLSQETAGRVSAAGTTRYRECQKNHAASLGNHAVDGCGEFMPGGGDDGDALKCAACGCHRNFHRREVEGENVTCDCHKVKDPKKFRGGIISSSFVQQGGGGHGHGQGTPISVAMTNPMPIAAYHHHPSSVTQFQGKPITPIMMAMSTGAGTNSDEQEGGGGGGGGGIGHGGGSSSPSAMKKRFRTKFTAEQKDEMCTFAEKLGWKLQKHDEAAVQEFCANVGIKRHVLKVWMHNNKHTMAKKD